MVHGIRSNLQLMVTRQMQEVMEREISGASGGPRCDDQSGQCASYGCRSASGCHQLHTVLKSRYRNGTSLFTLTE
jgi:hypothetical protein